MKHRIVMVGAGGYADYCLKLLDRYVDKERYQLVGVVDPFVQAAPGYERLKAQGVPMYDLLEDFYAEQAADLAIISSPIPFHKAQCLAALRGGSAVLCEKPLVPLVQDAIDLKDAAAEAGKPLGVGFQWSWSDPMLAAKKDILDGLYGKPIRLKTHIAWKRPDSYYKTSSWKGRLYGSDGQPIFDSIATNATAHYLHNLFFILGDTPAGAHRPVRIEGSLYRGRDIENYDTCFLRGDMGDGCSFAYIATHACAKNSNPRFEYLFEKGQLLFDQDADDRLIGKLADGTIKYYGKPQSDAQAASKILKMLDHLQGDGELYCDVDTILPHLLVCNAMQQNMDISTLPLSMRVREDNPPSEYVQGLFEATLACYDKVALPDELGYDWATPAVAASI